MKKNVNYSVYLVTDENCLRGCDLLEAVEQALQGGVTLVQYRSKNSGGAKMYAQALALKALCDEYKAPLIVNDRLDIAMAVGAAGVHLGQNDLPCRIARRILGDSYIIGVSAHNSEEAQRAVLDGADYLGCGAVFGSQTKNDAVFLGLEGLQKIRTSVALPMVGIGGVSAANYASVLQTGADGAAVVSGILGAENIREQARIFTEIAMRKLK